MLRLVKIQHSFITVNLYSPEIEVIKRDGLCEISERNCCQLDIWIIHTVSVSHLLTNVQLATRPIYLNQIHEDFKCTEYGFHPHLNEKV